LGNEAYSEFQKRAGFGDGSRKSLVKNILFNHGHEAAWNISLLITLLSAVGFKASEQKMYQSSFQELQGLEGHGRVIGEMFNDIETCIGEGVK
jgi:hypothetical protein